MRKYSYSSQEVVAISGASYRMVDNWTTRGYLTETSTGNGVPRRYSFSDVVKATALNQLTRPTGMTLACADRILKDHHRKAKCVGDFGSVRVTVDVAAIRKSVRLWDEAAA
jgi:DNA-binding transcriptional MerR regulator